MRLNELEPDAEPVLEGLVELLWDAEVLELALGVCEDVRLEDDVEDAVEEGADVKDDDALAEALQVPVFEDEGEPLPEVLKVGEPEED